MSAAATISTPSIAGRARRLAPSDHVRKNDPARLGRHLRIEKLYVEDGSLGFRTHPHVFLQPAQPQLEVQIDTAQRRSPRAISRPR